MRETQMLAELGYSPTPRAKPSLSAPALHGDKGAWAYDSELEGHVPIRKDGETLSHSYQPKKTI